ncbi:MAG: hypothetical protein ACRCSQ_10190, partial [Bacteroidales bacterium]
MQIKRDLIVAIGMLFLTSCTEEAVKENLEVTPTFLDNTSWILDKHTNVSVIQESSIGFLQSNNGENAIWYNIKTEGLNQGGTLLCKYDYPYIIPIQNAESRICIDTLFLETTNRLKGILEDGAF